MKINEADIKKYDAKMLRYEITHRKIRNRSEWGAHTLTPFLETPQKGFKEINVYVAVYGKGKEDVIKKRSNLIASVQDVVELELDNYPNKFRCTLTGVNIREAIKRRCHEVELKFAGYEHGKEVTVQITGNTSGTVSVSGNEETPCILEIMPLRDISSYTIQGAARDPVFGDETNIVIKNLKTGKKIVLDGERGTVLEEGVNKFPDTDFWQFPSLKPGDNFLSFSGSQCNVTVKYKPRYI